MSRPLRHRVTSLLGMTALELAISVAVLGGFFGTAVTYHRLLLRRAQELALRADLQNLRAAVAFLQAQRGAPPDTLEAACAEPIGRLRRGDRWIGRSLRDQGQGMADVFGTPYRYDQQTARVWSATPGYESW